MPKYQGHLYDRRIRGDFIPKFKKVKFYFDGEKNVVGYAGDGATGDYYASETFEIPTRVSQDEYVGKPYEFLASKFWSVDRSGESVGLEQEDEPGDWWN